MNKLSLVLASLAFAATAVPAAANAQSWQPIRQREVNLDRRIDQGIRSGALNRNEAARLTGQFRRLTYLEARYRRSGGGLTLAERRDLDRRFTALSQRVRIQKHDRQVRRR